MNLADLTIGLNALTSPVTRYYVVGINDFVPYATTYTFLRNDHKLNPTSAGTQFFFAPVHLPDGATITAIDFYTTDISNTAWISWYMSERRQSTGAGIATIADAQGDITGTPGKENLAVSGLSHVVDNSQYYYQMRIYFSDGSTSTEFHSARITYQVSRPD